MKFSDTIELVLKSKEDSRVPWVTPDQSVYEGIERMAEARVGALLVISDDSLVGILSERDHAQCGPQGPFFEENPRWPDHDYSGHLGEPATHGRRVHGPYDSAP